MQRIIDGECYNGNRSADRWHVSLRKLPNGHREHSIRRAVDWSHVGPLHPDSKLAQQMRGELPVTDEELAEKRDRSLKRAARRAKAAVRLRCKLRGLDQLLTLTYRENVTDKSVAEAHFRAFLRLMRKVVPDFDYVAVFERQKRGAYHVHMAVRRLPKLLAARNGVRVKSFNVVRALWRKVVGDCGGNVNVGKLQRRFQASCARCAAYVSKYCLKDYAEGEAHSKRYWASKCDVPPAVRFDLVADSLADLIALVTADAVAEGGSIASFYLCPFQDSFFVAVEPPGAARP